jgi:predicted Zn-dependent protease with MMP-like domain
VAGVVGVVVFAKGLQRDRRSAISRRFPDDIGAAEDAEPFVPVADASADSFAELVELAIEALPAAFRERMQNLAFEIEDEPPYGKNWLGVYQGLPLTQRGFRTQVLPGRIVLFRGPIERQCADDSSRLETEVNGVVWHEVAHYFGINDERLTEIGRY